MSSTTQAHRSPALQPNRRHDISIRIRRKQVFLGISLALVAFRALNFVCPPKSLETGGELPEVACACDTLLVFSLSMTILLTILKLEHGEWWCKLKPHEATWSHQAPKFVDSFKRVTTLGVPATAQPAQLKPANPAAATPAAEEAGSTPMMMTSLTAMPLMYIAANKGPLHATLSTLAYRYVSICNTLLGVYTYIYIYRLD